MKVRPIGHEERLSLVDHLGELRSRVFLCLGVLIVAFGICFWQNGPLLDILNRALPSLSTVGQHGLAAYPNQSAKERAGLLEAAAGARSLASDPKLSSTEHSYYAQ